MKKSTCAIISVCIMSFVLGFLTCLLLTTPNRYIWIQPADYEVIKKDSKKEPLIDAISGCFDYDKECYAYDFTITIPDSKVVQLRDTLCIAWDYEGNKKCLDPPECLQYETKKQFVERKVREWLKNKANNFLEDTAAVAAKNAVVPIDYQ